VIDLTAQTLFRVVLIIPIAIIYGVLTAGATRTVYHEGANTVSTTSGGIAAGLFTATLLMILFRQRYPRWWFDFALELARFGARIGAYVVLLTDKYPSTVEAQGVHLEIDYPDVQRDLSRWLPLVKWLLAIPHFRSHRLVDRRLFAVIATWFVILFTGRYPRGLFDYVVGVGRCGCGSRRTRSFSSPIAIHRSLSGEAPESEGTPEVDVEEPAVRRTCGNPATSRSGQDAAFHGIREDGRGRRHAAAGAVRRDGRPRRRTGRQGCVPRRRRPVRH
jgi:hypothetical protein